MGSVTSFFGGLCRKEVKIGESGSSHMLLCVCICPKLKVCNIQYCTWTHGTDAYIIHYSFITEEERLFRANDRPYNLSYQYAVSIDTKLCAKAEVIWHQMRLHSAVATVSLAYVPSCVTILSFRTTPSGPPNTMCSPSCHSTSSSSSGGSPTPTSCSSWSCR